MDGSQKSLGFVCLLVVVFMLFLIGMKRRAENNLEALKCQDSVLLGF